MSRQLARPVAVALINRGDEILVFEVPDAVKHVVGWRLPGGTIENIFTYLGVAGHELVRVYAAHFADRQLYAQDRFDCVEANGVKFTCIWKSIADFRAGEPLYPEGLLELIG